MCTRSKKFCKRNRKAYIGNGEVTLRNSLSDFMLTQSEDKRKLRWRNDDRDTWELFSRRVQSLPATGGRTRSSVIDRDKRLRRKRRSKLDAYMDTLSLIKKKSTMCIPSPCLRESSRDSSVVTSGANSARTLSIISEIDRQTSTQYCGMNETVHVNTRPENDTENCWVLAGQNSKDEKVLKFIHTSEGFKTETSGDESIDASDLRLIELITNGRIGDGRQTASVETNCNAIQACFSKAGEKEIFTEVERDPCFEGKLKAKRSDSTEIQRDVSKSANIVQGVIEKSSMAIESSCLPIKHAIYHQFASRRILRDEISVQTEEREKTETTVDHRDYQSRDCVQYAEVAKTKIFSRQLGSYSLDPDNDRMRTRTLADKLSTAAFLDRISRCKSGKDVGGATSRENAESQGVYQDEDYHFLMSLHQQLNEMPLVRKMKVKAKIQTIFYEELRARICDPHTAA